MEQGHMREAVRLTAHGLSIGSKLFDEQGNQKGKGYGWSLDSVDFLISLGG